MHFHTCRRFEVCVRRIYLRDIVLERGDVVTDILLGQQTDALVTRGLIREGDYDLRDVRSPSDPWEDGRWMG
ncbi:MAG: hypothetical protein ACO1SV_02250 [Fimbriimonas sp.]